MADIRGSLPTVTNVVSVLWAAWKPDWNYSYDERSCKWPLYLRSNIWDRNGTWEMGEVHSWRVALILFFSKFLFRRVSLREY